MTHTLTTYNEAVHTALHILATDMGYEIPPLGHVAGGQILGVVATRVMP